MKMLLKPGMIALAALLAVGSSAEAATAIADALGGKSVEELMAEGFGENLEGQIRRGKKVSAATVALQHLSLTFFYRFCVLSLAPESGAPK